jgi:hypothetical protein
LQEENNMRREAAKKRLGAITIVVVFAVLGLAAWAVQLQDVLASAGSRIYLPMVSRMFPPIPGRPWLHAINNPDGDGNYTVRWGTAALAESYELEEQWESGNWFTAYSGSATQVELRDRPPGKYRYRCRAQNSWGPGPWSNLQAVTVKGNPPGEISTPPSSPKSAGGMSVIKVTNDCPYVLRLEFTGPGPTVMSLPKCDVCKVYSFMGPIFCPTTGRPTQEIQLVPGEYRVFVSVADPSVQPYIGHWQLQGDRRYSVCFFIVSRWSTEESDSMGQMAARNCK